MRIPSSTYRVQLSEDFTFDDLTRQIPYLAGLGVSECYCSPIFRATPGSKHGYDVCDYEVINPELGGEEGLRRLSAKLREHGMGLLLDFVPNHMGIDGPFNRWWRDVMENGTDSRYAEFFDISWWRNGEAGAGRVLAPLLSDHYGVLLESGKLRLEEQDGELSLAHESARFPVRSETYAEVLRGISETSREDPKMQLKDALQNSEAARGKLASYLKALNGRPGDPASFDQLDRMIEAQHYRLTRWHAGVHGVNYRRFFAIDTLMGIKVENPRVFAAVHRRLSELIRNGIVTGLRIDHIDGLRDPEAYLRQLQILAAEARGVPEPFYVAVEKILAPKEMLPPSWPVQGTTGYEFIPLMAGLFTDSRHERAFDRIYSEFTGNRKTFEEVAREKKLLVLSELFDSTVHTLAQALVERVSVDRRWRDLTVAEVLTALRALLSGFRVYRTYRRGDGVTAEDRAEIALAAASALKNHPQIERNIIEFIRDVLLGDYPEPGATQEHRDGINEWVKTVQQYTGAVMAKAVEDTAYYTCNRLIALNDVGGEPSAFGGDIERFHRANLERLARSPNSLLTTSTHDTKVSEDVRARLYALSEIPEEWERWSGEWRELNASCKTKVGDRFAPDADEEYRLYQTVLGAWPGEGGIDDRFRERITGYFRKAISEAKVNTWAAQPNEPWLKACDHFVEALLADGSAFRSSVAEAAREVSRLGWINSFSQTVLKLTVPGVPDIYQGNEAGDFSLVDPDNRRPVDYDELKKLAAREGTVVASFSHLEPGKLKQTITRALLRLRQKHPQLFAAGRYIPVKTTGRYADHSVAFFREGDGERLLVIVPRLTGSLSWPPIGTVWADTSVRVGGAPGRWTDVLTGRARESSGGEIRLVAVFADLPVAILQFQGTGQTA